MDTLEVISYLIEVAEESMPPHGEDFEEAYINMYAILLGQRRAIEAKRREGICICCNRDLVNGKKSEQKTVVIVNRKRPKKKS